MDPLFLGSHPAIDFLNTSLEPKGERIELIGDGKSLQEWTIAAGILDAPGASRLARKLGSKGMDGAAAEARKLREWARAWLTRWRAGARRDYGTEIEALNKLLEKRTVHQVVVTTQDGLAIEARSDVASIEELLAVLAAQIADLITQEDPDRLKSCAGEGCTLWFLDRTKAQRRLFCSAATCGNRAKVAAFRERQRE
jgi:predicted RNA-binding Zn ribbon-like protein